MGISRSTLNDWRGKYSDISNAIKNGKEVTDFIVENALFKSATGEVKTLRKPIKVKTEKSVPGKGKIIEERIEYADEQIYIPPQVTAQIFWLKNRKPQEWRDKREVDNNIEFESDNFIEALRGQVKDTFENAGDIIEK